MTNTTSGELVKGEKTSGVVHVSGGEVKQFVTMEIGEQLFGFPVLVVEDILRPLRITSIPLSPYEILGAINLRGRIVTVIDMRRRLGLPPQEPDSKCNHIVVNHVGDQYSFVIDSVGDVMSLHSKDFERNPPNLSEKWRDISRGVYRLDERLLVVCDIESLLTF